MTARKLCITCHRGPRYFEGCSHIDCPCRKHITAQESGGTDTPIGYLVLPKDDSETRAETIGEDEK